MASFELFIARRLSLRNSGSRKSPAVAISIIGIALALIVMTVSVSVVTGFKQEIRNKVIGFDSQISVQSWSASSPGRYDAEPFIPSDSLLQIIHKHIPRSAIITGCIHQPGILKTDNDFLGVMLNGIDTSTAIPMINESLISGSMPDFSDPEQSNNAVISLTTAQLLGLDIGDKILTYMFVDNRLRVRNLQVAAIYNTSFGEYDRTFIFCSSAMLRKILGVDQSAITDLNINGMPLDIVQETAYDLQTDLAITLYGSGNSIWYQVDNVYQTGALYFSWLDLLDTNVVVILILMALVSGFSLVSCLFIIILERVQTIGLLKSMGAPDSMIRRIFVIIGQRLVITGMIIGNIVSLGFLITQHFTELVPLDPEAYYLDHVPVSLDWCSILAVNAGVFLLSWALLLIPVCIVARISPSRTMKYE